MTIPALLSWAEDVLIHANLNSPRVDAEWILTHILGCSRAELSLSPPPTSQQINTFRHLVTQRTTRIPLQHLLGETEFYGLPFKTTPQALIPRPDTETLVEAVITRLKNHLAPTLLDIGTGSGIIAITLAHALPQAQVIAIDISQPALRLAQENAHLNQVKNRIHFLQSNLFDALGSHIQFDAIVSNPPYIPTSHIATLEPEVRHFDPHLALDGGKDGLDIYRTLIPQSLPHLKPKGILALEIGHDQAQTVSHIITQHPQLTHPTILLDLAGHTRSLLTQKQN